MSNKTGRAVRGLLVVISAPSATGKTTICRELLRRNDDYAMSVSATTRGARKDEKDGRDYFFVSPDKFQEMVDTGEFLEYAELFGARYGTPRAPVVEAVRCGKVVLLDIDIQGAMQLKDGRLDGINSLFLFIVPPSVAELEARIRGRRANTEAEIRSRLARAREEMESARHYDHVTVNDSLERAIAEIEAQIERCRK